MSHRADCLKFVYSGTDSMHRPVSLQPETNSLVISHLVSALMPRVSRRSSVVLERVSSAAIKANAVAVRLMEASQKYIKTSETSQQI
jgi:hypothetical protein